MLDAWTVIHKAAIDKRVRAEPERAYDVDFFEEVAKEVGWKLGN